MKEEIVNCNYCGKPILLTFDKVKEEGSDKVYCSPQCLHQHLRVSQELNNDSIQEVCENIRGLNMD